MAKAEDDALTEAVFNDIMNSVDNAVNIVDNWIWGGGLKSAISCRFIKSGSIEIQVGEKSPIVIDYGDGVCDNKATVTKDGETREILLKLKQRVKPG